jgi:monovalent cation:H+ antiporter-2, CPA2 family
MTIAETTENHAVFTEVRPLRDLFSVVFFVSIALLVPGDIILANLPTAFILSIVVMVVKFLTVGAITLYFGYHSKVAFLVAAGLVQVGEFSFVLIREGIGKGLVSEDAFSLVLSVSVISIIATPLIFTYTFKSYKKIRATIKQLSPRTYTILFRRGAHLTTFEELPFQNHVVLCGFGRMGKYIGRALESADIPYVVVEYNRYIVNSLRTAGINVVYGDPADRDILDFAQVDKAKLLIVAIPDLHTQRQVIAHAKSLKRDIKIISRTHHESDQKVLKTLGANYVVQPEFVAALAVVGRALHQFNLSADVITGKIARLKIEHGMG